MISKDEDVGDAVVMGDDTGDDVTDNGGLAAHLRTTRTSALSVGR